MKTREPALGFIFITLFLDVLGLGLIVPVLPKLIETLSDNDIQAASGNLGLLIALFALMQFLFSPIIGSLSDKIGRRPVILISLLGSGFDYLLLSFAPTLSWLFVGRVVAGVTSANITAVTAYIADVSPPEKRAQNFGLLGAAFGLGFIAGPVIGGLLGNLWLRLPFLVVAGITFINWMYGFFVLPESLAKANRRPFDWRRANPVGSLKGLTRYPLVFALAATYLFTGLGQNILQSIWVLYTGYRYNWGPAEVGVSLTVVGLSAALVQGGLIRRIVPRLGERRSMVIGLLIGVMSFTLYGLATQPWMFYVIPILGALGGIAAPSAQAIISKTIAANEQGEMQGALASLNSLTGIAAPLIGTAVFSFFISEAAPFQLPGAPFLVGALFFLIGALLAVRTFRRIPEVKLPPVAPPPMAVH